MKSLRPIFALTVSASILIAIFSQIEIDRFSRHFINIDWGWFGLSMFLFAPVYFFQTVRLRYLMGRGMRYSDSLKTILASSSLNVILPSKGGDLAKGLFVQRHIDADRKTCFSAVIFERVTDVTVLVLILLNGLAVIGDDRHLLAGAWIGGLVVLSGSVVYFVIHLWGWQDGWTGYLVRWLPKVADFIETSRFFVRDIFRTGKIIPLLGLSLALWLVHVFQFYCFFAALDYQGPWVTILAYVPAAIFIGLLPITVAGVGTRDLALIVFFAPWAPTELAAGVGLLSHLRYILPGLVGCVMIQGYLKDI